MRAIAPTILIVALLTQAGLSFAAPTRVSQQGRLLDGDAVPFEGTHALVFTLHDAQTEGNVIWEEMQAVPFEKGYYSVTLGIIVALDDLLFASGALWLQLEVDGETLEPRQEIVSVPYALRASTAEGVEGGLVDADEVAIAGSVVIDSAGNWVGPTPAADWAGLTGVPADLADGDADGLGGLSCIDQQVARWSTGSGLWVCDADLDTQLTGAEVLAFVLGTPLDLLAGSTLSGQAISTGAHTTTLPWSSVTGIPADIADGDQDTDTDTLASLGCFPGEMIQAHPITGLWSCVEAAAFVDSDLDGVIDSADCQPNDASISPLAFEQCDGVDNNCDGVIDEDGAVGSPVWYADIDGDGTAGLVVTRTACSQPPGFFTSGGDCDDTNPLNYPGAAEVCDGLDNDCNGSADFVSNADDGGGEGDGDGDGVIDCADCLDTNSTVFPNATEVCDGVDNNCDGTADEELLGTGPLCPGLNCLAVLNASTQVPTNASYYIDPDGSAGPEAVTLLPCDMTGGGWIEIIETTSFAYQTYSELDSTQLYAYAVSDSFIAALKANATEGKQEWACQTNNVSRDPSQSNWVVWDNGNTSQFPSCQSAGNNSYESDSGTYSVFADLPAREWHPQDCGDGNEACQHNVESLFLK